MRAKFVNEIKLEGSHLERMGIGLRAKITRWLDDMRIKDYTINDDLTVDVDGNVYIGGKGLTSLPIRFNMVKGDFSCSSNELISLDGCPKSVSKSFSCAHNRLTSIKGCPESVGSSFYCHGNKREFTRDEIRSLCKIKGALYT